MKKISLFFVFLSAVQLLGVGYDLTGGNRDRWYLGRFKKSGFVRKQGFVVRNGEYGSLRQDNAAVDCRKYGTLQVKFQGKPWASGKLYFSNSGKFTEASSVRGRYEDGMMVFNCHLNRNWKGLVKSFRLDILPDSQDDTVIRELKFSAADDSIALYRGPAAGRISVELLMPEIGWSWKGNFTSRAAATVEYLDIYGKKIASGKLEFAPGNTGGREVAPAAAAKLVLDFGRNGSGSIRLFQERNLPGKVTAPENRKAVLKKFPAISDEKSVFTPEIEFAQLQNKGRFQLFLQGENSKIFLADQIVSGKQIELPELTLKYLSPGKYQVKAKLNGAELQLGGITLEHRNAQTSFALPQVTVDHSGNCPVYVVNGSRISTMEYLSSDPPLSDDALHYADLAARTVPVLAYRLIFRFNPDGSVNYSELDSAIQSLLLRHPEKAVFIHVSVTDPSPGYRTRHPGEGIRDDRGEFRIKNYRDREEATSSMASEHWLESSKKILKELMTHLQKVPYGERIIGVLPCSGITWEWLNWGSARGVMVDYSSHYRKYYAAFLRKRYNNRIDALNRAWNSSHLSFEDIEVPSPERRRAAGTGDLRLGDKFQDVIDHIDSVSELISSNVLELCRTVKEASGRRILSGTYYGYINYLLAGGRSHDCGHNAFYRVLTSPDVDIMMAPSRYAGRGLGGGGGFMHPEGSVKLHKKLIISECDVRTPAAVSNLGRTSTLAGTRAVVEREYASQLSGGAAMRYFDFSHGWITGDRRIFEVMKKTAEHCRKRSMENSGTMPDKYIAGVYTGAGTAARISRESRLNIMLVENSYRELLKSGIAFNMYAVEDLAATDHRVLFLLNTLRLDEASRREIIRQSSRAGKVIFFHSGCGMVGDKGIDTGFISQLFGTDFAIEREQSVQRMTITADGEKYLGIPAGTVYTMPHAAAPLFFPEAGGTVLARNSKGQVALLLKKGSGADLIWSALPVLPAELAAGVAVGAGLPVVNTTPRVPVWFNRGVLAVHTDRKVEVKFDLRNFPVKLTDWENGKAVPLQSVRQLPAQSTWLLNSNWMK